MGNKHRDKPKHGHQPEAHKQSPCHLVAKEGVVYSVRIEPPTDHIEKTTAEKDYRKKQLDSSKWLNRISAVGIVIAFLTFVALVAYACITHKQLVAMLQSNGINHDALVASSRAWIAPANAYFTGKIAKNTPLSWEVQYRNTGRSPALDTHAIYDLQKVPASVFENNTFNAFIESDKASEDCKHLGPALGADVIYPDQPDGYKLLFTNHLSDWVTDDVLDGRTAVVLQMCFAYKTMTETHHTSFCYFYRFGVSLPNKQMNICTAGNHAD